VDGPGELAARLRYAKRAFRRVCTGSWSAAERRVLPSRDDAAGGA